MMVKRKLDGAVGESSADQEIRQFNVTVYVSCEKYRGLHLAEPGLTAAW